MKTDKCKFCDNEELKKNAIKNKIILYYKSNTEDDLVEFFSIFCKNKNVMDIINENIVIEHKKEFDYNSKKQIG